jgi:acyl-CoA synthetase (AMP-forming)/AMP-acid ligase II
VTGQATQPASVQLGPDALVTELVRGVRQTCYADRPSSVVALLEDALGRSAPDLLLIDPAVGSTTYEQFAALVEGAADALLGRGLRPGDRVAVLARNGLEAAVAIWACARAGLLHVGLPADAPPDRLAALLALTTPALLLTQDGLAGAARTAAGAVPVLDAAAVLLGAPRPWRTGRPLPDQDETYCLIATSGTTGHPKAVRVTGRMTGHAAAFYARTLGLTAADRTAIHLPFAWVSGHVTQLAPAMASGGSAVTLPAFSATALLETAAEHAVTWLDVVPSIFEMLLRVPDRLPELRGVRLAVFGGAPAPPGTLDRVRAALPQLRLFDVYALSETCAPVTCLPDVEALRRPGTVGRPVAYCEVRLAGPDGRDVPRGEPGEVLVRSPTTTPGYWGAEPSPLVDGWLRTGDVGRLDAEGYLSVGGRAVDLIIRGGVNIYPAEVERALLGTGVLSDAAVVGLPSRVAGESVAAAVVGLPGAAVDPGALQRAVRDRLGAHAVPRPLLVVDELPRNRNGKTDRAAVRALLAGPAD